jgi:tetracycline repressor-like protein
VSSSSAILFDLLSAHLEKLVAVVQKADEAPANPQARLKMIIGTLLESYRHADAEHQVQIASLKLLPKEKQAPLLAKERILVDILADALAAARPSVSHKRVLKPLTMTVFGMLNWHYLWFREGGAMTRAEYADFVTRLVLAGANDAAAAVSKANGKVKPASKGRQKELL